MGRPVLAVEYKHLSMRWTHFIPTAPQVGTEKTQKQNLCPPECPPELYQFVYWGLQQQLSGAPSTSKRPLPGYFSMCFINCSLAP
jgi:hypothetical protein